MASMEDHERKVVAEFVHLLEKSKQLFNGLRDLPQYGHKQWQAYFGRTFDIYTKLWKFQQQHRWAQQNQQHKLHHVPVKVFARFQPCNRWVNVTT